ncbi:pentapeptide repeat-containing protein [Microbacterium marinilacus]|uniref:Pentapeptide repeat-containing protein n=1 Tax=Microbacterium marinilacus TaxID=415209 RepID=A0ABP7B272_9MICO|nr:pentapeptide repeat-containing protein [Microbacterium marinilacus]MBY0688554.1 pentapeptide repeat-containing protein [Microbacterium marinilacus]
MARPRQRPVAPRVSPPDLPSHLEQVSPRRHGDEHRARFTALAGAVDLAHSALEECLFEESAVDGLDLTGATLIDVDVRDLRAASVSARDTTIRRMRVFGGRLGTLDLSGARIAELELRDVRIDYLTLGGARGEDILVADCAIRSLDVPQATLTRVAFDGVSASEVDPRGLRAADVDMRGLDAESFLDVASLRGVTLTSAQVERLAPAFAAAAGIDVQG